ncbi:hypothetical protein [Arachidicoccus ginsenosidimutans]|uniref:hypothetical protein n=1 Tax=Arachidicoccus sp. BS20 TaxID=1850526 RepID=UPI0012E933A1|nr:hypothetical protein [Arachidicoccus sp. BS20]
MSEEHKSFFDKAKDALSQLKDKAEETYENLHVDEKLNEALASAKEAASELSDKAGEAWESAKETASNLTSHAGDALNAAKEKAGEAFDTAKDKLSDALSNEEDEAEKTA